VNCIIKIERRGPLLSSIRQQVGISRQNGSASRCSPLLTQVTAEEAVTFRNCRVNFCHPLFTYQKPILAENENPQPL